MTSWSHFNRCVRTASGINHFILHDLRRTFSTLMAENTDVSENIIDASWQALVDSVEYKLNKDTEINEK